MNKTIIILAVFILLIGITSITAFVWNGINITRIKGDCINTTKIKYNPVTYNYTCLTTIFNYTLNPRIARCYDNIPLPNGTYPIIFEHYFDRGNMPLKTVWWEELNREVSFVENCETIGWKIGNNQFIYKDYAECTEYIDTKCIVCDSKKDGNGDGICQSGESCLELCVDDLQNINKKIKDDSKFMDWFDLK